MYENYIQSKRIKKKTMFYPVYQKSNFENKKIFKTKYVTAFMHFE